MRGLVPLSRAMLLGFVRDRMALFFTLLFPLMFLVLFGGIFSFDTQARSEVLQVGDVPILDRAPREQVGEVDITRVDDLAAAIDQVGKGDADAAVEQHGDELVLHFSRADQVQAATVQGTIGSFVSAANQAVSGEPPRYRLRAEQVEDDSLEAIQFLTPGLLGWAIAMSATFGAALTLVTWRKSRLLRKLRLAPVPTASIVGARVGVSMLVALVQMAVFLGLAMAFFGLRLTGSWWMAIPLVLVATLSFLAIGLLAGAVTRTPESASGLANLIVLPMAFLSGSFFPLEGAPAWLQAISRALPLRHLNEGMLDVMVRGLGPSAAWAPIGVLLGFGLVVGLIAVRLFRWEAD
ncbi:MAG: ABC transporter permease [Propionibacteriales bacterium]|nr:ABC transporter permease [Propionibacteriales bacterium]